MPPPAAAPPPAAPPASPPPPAAPPAADKTTTTTTTPPPAESESWLDGVGRELAELDDSAPPKPVKSPGETKPPKDETKPPVAETKPPEDATKGMKSETPPEPAKPIKAADLRVAFENLKKERAEVLQPKIQQLEAKVKELEAAAPEEMKPLQEKLTALEKRNAELEDRILFVDYTKSKEYQEKFHQPYVEAWTRAVREFGQLNVKREDAQGNVVSGPATADDLLFLANLPLSEIDERAEQMFGKSAARVIRHVERVRELAEAQNNALADAAKRGVEKQKSSDLETRQTREREHGLFKQYIGDIVQRFPKTFGPEEGDTEGNELLKRGESQADRLFLPDPNNPFKSPEERIQFHALMRNKIANHDRLVNRNKRLAAELAEVKKALEEYEKSAPPGGKAGEAKAVPKSWDQQVDEEIAALDKP